MSDLIEVALAAAQAQVQSEGGTVATGTPTDAPVEGAVAEGTLASATTEDASKAPSEGAAEGGDKQPEEPATHAEIRKRQKDLDRQGQDLRKKEAKFKARLERWQSEKATIEAQSKQTSADLEMLRRGDARSILGTLAKLTGRDPVSFYREMSLAVASDGKATPETQTPHELMVLKEELAEVKKSLQERIQTEQRQTKIREVRQRIETELAQLVTSEAYPELREYAKVVGATKAVGELHDAMLNHYRERKESLTTGTICKLANAGLRERDWRAKLGVKLGQKPSDAEAGSDTRVAQATNTEQEPSTPRGQSLAPSAATTAARTRPLTDEEAQREMQRLAPGVLAELGLRIG